jgi:predicted RNA-binding Zn ribbon-like protein
VVFAHDTEFSLGSAVELANSALEPDTLTTVADLEAFFVDWGYTGHRAGDAAELEAVRQLRPRLRSLLTAGRDEAVEIVNAWLAEANAVPRLVRHEPLDWHIHAVDDDSPLPTRILVETAMAMIDVIRSDEMSRLGICADEGCEGIVLDLSRNRSRRYCSVTCGNRNAVAAYRARQAGSSA